MEAISLQTLLALAHEELRRALGEAVASATRDGHRMIISAGPSSSEQAAALDALLSELVGEALLQPRQWATADAADQLQALLGSERQHVHFRLPSDPVSGVASEPGISSYRELDAGLLAAVCGTLRAGGVLHLSAACEPSDPFARRLLTALRLHGKPYFLPAGTTSSAESKPLFYLLQHRMSSASDASAEQFMDWQAEQDHLLDAVTRDLTATTRGCVVVKGRRGRGKSSLLGRLAARLFANGREVHVVAEQAGALTTIRRHWAEERQSLSLPSGSLPRLSLQLAFQGRGECLLVDEAAVIPLPALVRLAERFDRLILVTTTEGYEGTGRGFTLRLEQELSRIGCATRHHRLVQPVRWSAGDPLEALLDHALLLDLAPAAGPLADSSILDTDHLHLRLIDRNALRDDEPRLRQLASLLMQAHYRTTLQDLRHLLMQTPVQLHVLEHGNDIVGVALVALEGVLPASIHPAILARRRRLADQVLPQLLAQSLDEPAPLALRYARVVRIAVVPMLQGRGLGSTLLAGLSDTLRESTDALGASFGADTRLLRFWMKQGFTPVHRGLRRNARSGLRAVCVLKALRLPAADPVDSGSALLRLNLAALGEKPDDLMDLLTTGSPLPASHRFSDKRLLTQLVRYAHQQRSSIDSAAALRLWSRQLPADEIDRLGLDLDTWFADLLNGKAGRRAREENLRTQVARTLPMLRAADA